MVKVIEAPRRAQILLIQAQLGEDHSQKIQASLNIPLAGLHDPFASCKMVVVFSRKR